MSGSCLQCPCVVRVYVDNRDLFLYLPGLEIHDYNEWLRYKKSAKIDETPSCGCRDNNVADCIAKCDGDIVAVELTSYLSGVSAESWAGHFKNAGCGVKNHRRVLVLVAMLSGHIYSHIYKYLNNVIVADLCNIKSQVCSATNDAVLLLRVQPCHDGGNCDCQLVYSVPPPPLALCRH
ncbi:MAG: hypothetical protein QXT27_07400 [Pyrobaculum sp.]